MQIRYEFDAAKDAANRDRHGLPLSFGASIFDDDDHLILPTLRPEDCEERFKVIRRVGGRLFTVVYTWRGSVCRMISVRRSNTGEERAYRAPG